MITLILIKILCYLLTFFLIGGACLVISSYRLIYAIFSLVLVFFSGLWFFIMYEAEYALFIFLVVYLGAVVVFFIFVIMLVNSSITPRSKNLTLHEILGVLSFFLLILLMFLFSIHNSFDFGLEITKTISVLNTQEIYVMSFTNIEKIGFILYTDFGILLLLIGFLLFVSILGCVLILKPLKKNENQ